MCMSDVSRIWASLRTTVLPASRSCLMNKELQRLCGNETELYRQNYNKYLGDLILGIR